jgi:pyruvate/2-oxoacid:ferredoxin oxidoreductase alpha subunit
MVKQMRKHETRVITGNACTAYAVKLCRPDVIALYPITPQSEVVEQLTKFKADGLIDTDMVEVEGENSAMNTVTAACVTGGRVFTATASYGLAFMYDAMMQTSGYRAPVVMVNVNREIPGIHAVSTSQQDLISVRDIGWLQVIVEDDQEIIDAIIQAYRLLKIMIFNCPSWSTMTAIMFPTPLKRSSCLCRKMWINISPYSRSSLRA